MQFQPGNNMWERRSKHGRAKLFETPQLLWEAACEYFEWCQANPLIAIEYYGKDAQRCEVPKVRAFTMQGLCLYLDCNTAYFRQFKSNLKETDTDFSTIITRIEETVYNQKFEHAAAGFLNANIISRDLGLTDKSESTVAATFTNAEELKNLING